MYKKLINMISGNSGWALDNPELIWTQITITRIRISQVKFMPNCGAMLDLATPIANSSMTLFKTLINVF